MTSIACLGELLLRLSTPVGQLLAQNTGFEVQVGGAEANVAVALARYGHAVRFLTALPDNPLGQRCLDELHRHGVNTAHCNSQPGRLGLYFLTPGTALRPSQVVYDRAQSVFANHAAEQLNDATLLSGCQWLHTSGVSAALSAPMANFVPTLLALAQRHGVRTSFDCNYRAKLWSAWNGDAASCFSQAAQHAEILFADARSLGLILKKPNADSLLPEQFAELSHEALVNFPGLQYIACTQRKELSANHHQLGAKLRSRQQLIELPAIDITPITDRIGTGDAFAAGLLHGLFSQQTENIALEFALSAACLKHTVQGDFNLVSLAEIEQHRQRGAVSVQR